MQRRKFLRYAAVSGAGILGTGYLYRYATDARRNAVTGNADADRNAAPYTPLFVPGTSGPFGILDITEDEYVQFGEPGDLVLAVSPLASETEMVAIWSTFRVFACRNTQL